MTVTVALPSTVSPLGSAVSQTLPAVTDNPITADFIDPATGDFASMVQGLNPIDAQVILSLSTVRGSGAAVMEEGNSLMGIDKIRPTVQREVQSEVRFALRRLTANRDIRIESFEIEADRANAQVNVVLNYTNLRAQSLNAVALVITN